MNVSAHVQLYDANQRQPSEKTAKEDTRQTLIFIKCQNKFAFFFRVAAAFFFTVCFVNCLSVCVRTSILLHHRS